MDQLECCNRLPFPIPRSSHCPKLYQGVKCFNPFMDMVKGCVSEESYEIFEALRSWFHDILEYLCENNGANVGKYWVTTWVTLQRGDVIKYSNLYFVSSYLSVLDDFEEYDKQKHDTCTREINRHIITCAAENLIATPEVNRKTLSEENCR